MTSGLSALRPFFEAGAQKYPDLRLMLFHGLTEEYADAKARFPALFNWDFSQTRVWRFFQMRPEDVVFQGGSDKYRVVPPDDSREIVASFKGNVDGAEDFMHYAGLAAACVGEQPAPHHWLLTLRDRESDGPLRCAWQSRNWPGNGGSAFEMQGMSPHMASMLLIDELVTKPDEGMRIMSPGDVAREYKVTARTVSRWRTNGILNAESITSKRLKVPRDFCPPNDKRT